MATRVIAVLCERGSPALAALPSQLKGCALKVCSDSTELKALSPAPEALVWVPPAKPAHLLDAWPQLSATVRWFHAFSAGVDSLRGFFDASGLARPTRTAAVTNGKGAFSESLAEYVLWAMLYHCKRTERCQGNKAARRWDHFVMPQLKGKTVSFVGFGHIATTAAPLCRALGMRVLALRANPQPHPLADEVLGSSDPAEGPANKARAFAEADYVVCSLPGTPATRHFCDAAAFQAMKPEGVFISLGRGVAVDERALADALQGGQIAGASCDVFETEPLPEASPLWDCPNMLITAHNADQTHDYFEKGWGVWRANYDRWVEGADEAGLATPIDPARGY